MSILSDFRSLEQGQRHVIAASYLGWTLDAFDYFILVFVLKNIATDFGTSVKAVTLAITLTLAARPIGALIFGLAADRFGRRPTLMVNVLLYSILEFASGFAPSLTVLIVLRALYGVAMGGEWGVGASLTLESVPPKLRGLVSGLLQAGYPSGYLLASIVFFALFPLIGWRGMFMVGVIPALLVLYIRRNVDESPAFLRRQQRAEKVGVVAALRGHIGLALWAIVMMAGFNFFSHGTQDVYPTFLETQRGMSTHQTGAIAITYNIGAILGGLFFGAFSERIGRRRAIVIAAILALPVIPLWAYSTSGVWLAIGAFLMQFFVQGAWGVVPVHLNEISPDAIRGTFPGVVYQLGNLLASYNSTLQAGIAEARGGDYAFALALVAGIVAVVVAVLAGFGREARGIRFGTVQGKAEPAPATVTPIAPG
ncbi:MFS transporter, SHS family, lactate transporter [Faunimonas pinastri]|uniref:MFS transporter, SHS family, lactate transporter n=1 Tax=Faunimonas pinastri TaxID=1855383 RepID=A0A1H9QH15_9HYPH|nr:MFS transporter [Faunimonas pinastri]SER59841.1 MFS transporter, SHS family, lactate transporter [Faunimonas pinastri]